jgi:hypothetical protein
MGKWTKFMDMHSGGGTKEDAEYIYIEAPEEEAEIIFYNRFGHNPHRVSCTCCGADYSLTESDSLEEATAYERNCAYDKTKKQYVERGDPERTCCGKYVPLDEYLASDGVLVIRADDIKPDERIGSLPEQGYVWID